MNRHGAAVEYVIVVILVGIAVFLVGNRYARSTGRMIDGAAARISEDALRISDGNTVSEENPPELLPTAFEKPDFRYWADQARAWSWSLATVALGFFMVRRIARRIEKAKKAEKRKSLAT